MPSPTPLQALSHSEITLETLGILLALITLARGFTSYCSTETWAELPPDSHGYKGVHGRHHAKTVIILSVTWISVAQQQVRESPSDSLLNDFLLFWDMKVLSFWPTYEQVEETSGDQVILFLPHKSDQLGKEVQKDSTEPE